MESIRLKNFRCLEDTGEIKIKPLTFLVGSNSSGKSSFLNFFPLLKQSIGERRRGPFLWNGDNIDLKDFKNVVKHGKDNIEIQIHLINTNLIRNYRLSQRRNEQIEDIYVWISICEYKNRFDRIKSVRINIGEIEYKYQIENDGSILLTVGNIDSASLGDKINLVNNNSLLPSLLFQNTRRVIDDTSMICIEAIRDILKGLNEENASDLILSRQVSLIGSHLFHSIEDFKKNIKRILTSDINDEIIEKLYTLNCYRYINTIIDTINIKLMQIASNLTYVGPLREATERYYRFQNLDVDEISPDGSNLAMYLYNLNESDRAQLNDWLGNVFGFTITTKADMGHVEIMIVEEDKDEQNLVDVGFGYTQVLPILVNIWKSLYIDAKAADEEDTHSMTEHILAIEQPELHLHPRFQAKLAVLLINVINEAKVDKKNIRFVIETHSEILLNKIGELIAMGRLDSNDTSVIIFNAKREKLNQYVELATYSKDGYLQNWPIGFLQKMLIKIHDDVVEAALKNDNCAIRLLEKLALAYKFGAHLVSASILSLEKLSKETTGLPEYYRHIYSQIKGKEVFMQSVYDKIGHYIIVSMNKIEGQETNNMLAHEWANFKYYDETHVLVENLLDYELFLHLIEYYKRGQHIETLNTRSYPLQGGGDTMSKVYELEIAKRNYFCLALMDSDRKYPSASFGGTAQKVIELTKRHKPIHCNHYVMEEVRESENLLPIGFIKSISNYKDYQIVKDDLSFNTSFFDLKVGLAKKGKMKDELYEYLSVVFSTYDFLLKEICNCRECGELFAPTALDCHRCCAEQAIVSGFGPKLLSTVLKDENTKENLKDVLTQTYLSNNSVNG